MKLSFYDDYELQKQIVVTVTYLDFNIKSKQVTLFDLWDIDGQLAECIEEKKRKFKKPFTLTDHGGYKHIILLEIFQDKHLDTLSIVNEE